MRRLVGAALLVAALAAPEVAGAAGNVTVSFSGGILTITGDDQNNEVTVGVDASNNVTVADENGPVTITGGTPTRTSTSLIQINVAGGDDTVTIDSSLNGGGPSEPGGAAEIEVEVNGALGSDTFAYQGGPTLDNLALGQNPGGGASMNVNGDGDVDDIRLDAETTRINLGNGNDFLQSGPPFTSPLNGVLIVNGDAGNDFIDGGLLTSILNGGSGGDNIGLFGGNNTVDGGLDGAGLFVFFGGTLTFNQSAGGGLNFSGSTLSGNAAQIHDLFVQGSTGNDILDATTVQMPLTVLAGNGNDKVTAGSGDDDLFGDQGDDELRGKSGNDNINGGDGNDSCEGETQTFCEILILDPAPGPGGGGTNNPTNPPNPNPLFPTPNPLDDLGFFRPFVREAQSEGLNGILAARGFFVPFNAAQPGVYDFSLLTQLNFIFDPQSAGPSQRRRQIVLAKATKRVTTAGRVRVKVKLTRQGRKALRRARRVRTTFRARYTSPAGERYSASRKFSIKRKRR